MSRKSESLLRRKRMEITLSTLIEQFASTKKIEGRTDKTVNWYKDMLCRFVKFKGDVQLRSLTLDDARGFVARLQAQENRWENHPICPVKAGGLSPYTISAYVRSLKVFSRWIMDEGYTKTDIFARLKRPKLPQPLIEPLTKEEIEDVLSTINPNTFLGARIYAIVLLLLDTGIRASELTSLTVDNVDFSQGTTKVMGKGRKERIIPFGASTKKIMLRYLTMFRPESDYPGFFLTTDGRPLTYNALKLIIDRLRQRCGISRLHLHLFRHSFSVNFLVNGGDLATLRLILGHCSLSVTQVYLRLSESQIKVIHNRFSPVDRMGLATGRRGMKVAKTR